VRFAPPLSRVRILFGCSSFKVHWSFGLHCKA